MPKPTGTAVPGLTGTGTVLDTGDRHGPGHEEHDIPMKVTVNYDVCASTGSCASECPEVFEIRSDGYLYVLQEEPDESLRPKLLEAEELCPTGAISIEG
jgi:ferredoxin